MRTGRCGDVAMGDAGVTPDVVEAPDDDWDVVAVVQALSTADAQQRENARRDSPDERGKGGSGDFK